ncbi:MAG TPA: hypothetical protein VEI74_09050 [Candidatus Methylomirabilis sp.]|nr:hypothetical protein [Candidatus Methylomirabilis sp.]
MNRLFIDRKFRLPRVWSNHELRKFAHLFTGDVVNVSGWQDLDKEGRRYRDYFANATSYTITNYKSEARGFQGFDNEVFLDLSGELPAELAGKFDVAFNHTVLEHIYEVHTAFRNLCMMTRDIVILVVPFLQQMHESFGDYWRFSPMTVKRLFEERGLTLLYLSFNSDDKASVYIFAIASRAPERWSGRIGNNFSYVDTRAPSDGFWPYIGCHVISNTGYRVGRILNKLLRVFGIKAN